MLPDQQPTRTPTISRIVQRREVVSHPRRLSVLRPRGACEERERPETGHPWPCFLSSLEWMEPQARYFSLCFPATNQPPRLPSREQYAAQLPIRCVGQTLTHEGVVLSSPFGRRNCSSASWKAPRGLDLCNWRGSMSRIKITPSSLVKCCPHHLILAVGRDTASIFRFASSSQMDR